MGNLNDIGLFAKNHGISLTKTIGMKNFGQIVMDIIPAIDLYIVNNQIVAASLSNIEISNEMAKQLIIYLDGVKNLRLQFQLRLGTVISKLPEWIGNFKQLTNLIISDNKLQYLPKVIGSLTQLTSLDISNNELKSLPDSIGNLTRLAFLDIRNNKLQSLPENIGNLTQLISLSIRNNKLQNLPENIGKLSDLHELDMGNNALKSLPKNIGNLTHLTSLDISNNELQSLPDTIGNLTQLTSLIIRNNKLRDLPENIGNLSYLPELDLRNNELQILPESIGNFSRLTSLNLSSLKLSMLNKSLLNLNLPFVKDKIFYNDGIILHDTKLEKMDISLFFQDRKTIEAFFSDDLVEANECKIIVLGKGDAGKTSLIKRLKKQGFSNKKITTKGICITDWQPFEDCDGRIRFWDFGGQLEMDIAHKCFMTPRSVYVVVFSAIEDSTLDQEALRWLDTIKTFASDSEVILVINKIDLSRNAALNERALKEKYPNIILPVIRTSALTNRGIDILGDAICEATKNSKSYRTLFNIKWVKIKQALEDSPESYIEDIRFKEICKKADVEDKYLQGLILDWFRDLGVSFYYKDSNRINMMQDKYYVLKPNWLTNGLYRLIVHAEDGTPFISHSDINKLLSEPKDDDVVKNIYYSSEEVKYVLEVSRYFEISYETKIGKQYFEFLPMKSRKDAFDNPLPFDNSLHIRWTAEYLPLILIYRLMVRRFDDLDQEHIWRYGAFFTDKTNTHTRAKVVVDLSETTLDMYVVSDNKRAMEFLDVLRKDIVRLFTDIEIKPKEHLIITIENKEGEISFDDLLYYLNENKKFDIPGLAKDMDAGYILGLYLPEKTIRSIQQFHIKEVKEMKFEARDIIKSNVAIGNRLDGDFSQKVENEVWKNDISDTDYRQIKELLLSFLISDSSDGLTKHECKFIEETLKEPKESGWQKLRKFFSDSANAITISTAIAGFLSQHQGIAEWIRQLF